MCSDSCVTMSELTVGHVVLCRLRRSYFGHTGPVQWDMDHNLLVDFAVFVEAAHGCIPQTPKDCP